MRAELSATLTRWVRDWRAYLLVALLALCAALPGVANLPVMDVDEARFAQASRQMLETGDFVRIRLQDQERNKKPAGVHWLQAASTAALAPLTGKLNAIWTYRLPSVLGVVLAALATLWAGRALWSPGTALIGAGLLAVGLLVGFEGMTAKTDALMLGLTSVAIAALARLRVAGLGFAQPLTPKHARTIALAFWAALACAVMVKGPIPLMVVGVSLAAIAICDRRAAGWMAPLAWWAGPVVALLIVAPWAIAIGVITEGRFYTAAFSQDLAPKLAGEDHAHAGFPGYHTLLLPLLMFPAAFALPAAVRFVFARTQTPAEHSAIQMLLAWAASLVVFELTPGKLLHYAMPIYPAVALLCAAGFVAACERGWRVVRMGGLALFGFAGLALAVAIGVALYQLNDGAVRAVIAGGFFFVVVAAGAAGLIWLRQPHARVAAAIACGLCLSIVLRGVILPGAPGIQLSAPAARLAQAADPGRPLWVVGYDEPSIVFLTRTSARLVDADVAAAGVEAGDFVLIDEPAFAAFNSALAARQLYLAPRAAPIEGLSQSSGDRARLVGGVVAARR